MHVFDRVSSRRALEFCRCQFRKRCKIRLHGKLSTDVVVLVTGTHSDAPDAASVEMA